MALLILVRLKFQSQLNVNASIKLHTVFFLTLYLYIKYFFTVKKLLLNENQLRFLIKENNEQPSLSEVISMIEMYDDSEDRASVASKYYQKIGEGMGRTVFQIDDDLVLKIANGDSSQNEDEYSVYNYFGSLDILPKIYYHADDFSWLISEMVYPAEAYDFVNIVGMQFDNSGYEKLNPEVNIHDIERRMKSANPVTSKIAALHYDRAIDNINGKKLYSDYIGSDTEAENEKKAYSVVYSVDRYIDWCAGWPEYGEGEGDEDEYYESLKNEDKWFGELYELASRGVDDLNLDNFGIARRNGMEYIVILDSGCMDNYIFNNSI